MVSKLSAIQIQDCVVYLHKVLAPEGWIIVVMLPDGRKFGMLFRTRDEARTYMYDVLMKQPDLKKFVLEEFKEIVESSMFRLVKSGERLYLVPKTVDIEQYPFAYRREKPQGILDIEELVFPLPVKPEKKSKERWWQKFWKTRRRQLGEEPGYAEVETKSIGKERYKWDWTPGQAGYRTDVVGAVELKKNKISLVKEKLPKKKPSELSKDKKWLVRPRRVLYYTYKGVEDEWVYQPLSTSYFYLVDEDEDFYYVYNSFTDSFYALDKSKEETKEVFESFVW